MTIEQLKACRTFQNKLSDLDYTQELLDISKCNDKKSLVELSKIMMEFWPHPSINELINHMVYVIQTTIDSEKRILADKIKEL